MSSPKMTRMFGFLPAAAGAGVCACACWTVVSRPTAPSTASDGPRQQTLQLAAVAASCFALCSTLVAHDCSFLTTQRNPTWLVEVSTGSAWRAAGR